MTSTLLASPTSADALAAGVRELHALLDRLHASPLGSAHGSAGPTVVEVDRAIRRLEALKFKLLVAADSTGVAQDAGYSGTEAWAAQQTLTSRTTAARQVALARELAPDAGHDATAAALDAGLVSPAHQREAFCVNCWVGSLARRRSLHSGNGAGARQRVIGLWRRRAGAACDERRDASRALNAAEGSPRPSLWTRDARG